MGKENRTKKAWMIVDKQDGHIRGSQHIYFNREDAKRNIEGTWPYKIVPCTITYEI